MPLHVDRTSISLNHPQRREWTIDRTQREQAAARAGERPAATDSMDRATVPAAAKDHPELQHVSEAEALVRALLGNGAALRQAHGEADPARVARLIAD
jgi:hypothetical protein